MFLPMNSPGRSTGVGDFNVPPILSADAAVKAGYKDIHWLRTNPEVAAPCHTGTRRIIGLAFPGPYPQPPVQTDFRNSFSSCHLRPVEFNGTGIASC